MEEIKEYSGFATPSFTLEGSDLFESGNVVDTYSTTEDGSKLIVGSWSKSVIDGLFHIYLTKPVTELMLDRERLVWEKTKISDEDADNYRRSLAEASPEEKTSPNNHLPKKQMVLDPETKTFKLL